MILPIIRGESYVGETGKSMKAAELALPQKGCCRTSLYRTNYSRNPKADRSEPARGLKMLEAKLAGKGHRSKVIGSGTVRCANTALWDYNLDDKSPPLESLECQ